jgi:integrase
MRGSVLRQTVAWTAEGQRFKTKEVGIAAGFTPDQLQPIHEVNWTTVFRVADPATGRKRQISKGGYRTRREAEVALRKSISAVDAGSYTRPTSLTVRDFVEGTWLPGLERGDLRGSTVAMYRLSANRYVLPHLGGQRLRDVTPVRLKTWLDDLKAAGVGDRTVQIAGITCHKIFKSALDLELLSRNPADNSAVREARPKSKAAPPVIWDAEQLRTFLNAQREDRLFPLWRLATMTGLRRGELAGLKWHDLDFDAGLLHVRQTIVVVGYRAVASEPKTPKSRRTIGLDPTTVAALRQHRARQAEELLAVGIQRTDDGQVFVRDDGRPYHPQQLTKMLAVRAKAAGVPVVKLHALRHGHATAGLELGVPMKVMSERLGHSSLSITADIYSHVSEAVDQAAAAQIATAIDMTGH